MYTYPTSASGYRMAGGSAHYKSRQNGPLIGIVLHVTAGIQDLGVSGSDSSAENTAAWGARSTKVSWHAINDSDSIVPCLPDTYTGWHAKGYNSRTWGLEISNSDARWNNKPAAWTQRTVANAARACAPIVAKYKIPIVLASQSTVDRSLAAGRPFGFTYHSYLSDIRVDPGREFPFSTFISIVKKELGGSSSTPAPLTPAPAAKKIVVDGKFGTASAIEIQKYMRRGYGSGVAIDGSWDRDSALHLEYIINHEGSKKGWAKAATNGTTGPGATNTHTSRIRWTVGVNPPAGGWTEATTAALQKFINAKNGF